MENFSFSNNGIVKLNFENYQPEERRTVFVVGLPRSGTSLISSILNNIGIFTGDKSLSPTYEDKILKDLLDSDDWNGFSVQVKKYDQAHKLWGFKLPRATYKINEVLNHITNPVVILTVRDPLSLQIRKNISQKEQDIFEGVEETLNSYKSIFKVLSSVSAPILLASYDKVQNDPKELIQEMINICGLENIIHTSEVVARLNGDKDRYIENTRFDKTWGRIESISAGEFSGYALAQDPHRFESLSIEIASKDNETIVKIPCEEQPSNMEKIQSLTSEDGEIIERVFVKRNLRRFDGRICFRFRLNENQIALAYSIRVSGDRKPFYYFSGNS